MHFNIVVFFIVLADVYCTIRHSSVFPLGDSTETPRRASS